MVKPIDTARAFAIVGNLRSPGFQHALQVLEELALQIKERAFEHDDDASAVRLVHEGRGAAKLVREFKATLATLEESVRQPQT